MATVTLYQSENMLTALTWYGTVTGNTSSQITITSGYYAGVYSGSFQYAAIASNPATSDLVVKLVGVAV